MISRTPVLYIIPSNSKGLSFFSSFSRTGGSETGGISVITSGVSNVSWVLFSAIIISSILISSGVSSAGSVTGSRTIFSRSTSVGLLDPEGLSILLSRLVSGLLSCLFSGLLSCLKSGLLSGLLSCLHEGTLLASESGCCCLNRSGLSSGLLNGLEGSRRCSSPAGAPWPLRSPGDTEITVSDGRLKTGLLILGLFPRL